MSCRIVAMLFLVTMLCCAMENQMHADEPNPVKTPTIADFQREYGKVAEPDWKRRRQICMDVIDTEYIAPGKPLAPIAPIFGSDAIIVSGDPENRCTMFVAFKRQNVIVDETVQFGVDGWFLSLNTDDDGRIRSYYLRNYIK
jgi:hypothetical protein